MVLGDQYAGPGSSLSHIFSSHALPVLLTAFIGYTCLLGVYRLAFHPLVKFPGPKLAGLTYWYEFYYDVVLRGKYIFRIEELHKQYGPVLRVNPNEIHIADPEFYSEIYHSKSYKTDRDPWYNLDFIGASVAFTVDHDVHARRRAALVNNFSARSIRVLETRIQRVITKMAERLQAMIFDKTILDLRNLYAALTLDVISEYSFGESSSTGFMSHPNLGQFWTDIGEAEIPLNPFARQFKAIFKMALKLPDSITAVLLPAVADLLKWQDKLMEPVKTALKSNKNDTDTQKPLDEDSILYQLINNPNLSAEDRSLSRIRDESFLLLAAGGDTTASTLTRTTFHILDNKDVLNKLKLELTEAISDPQHIPSLDTISHLPYLNAVIEEGLRISIPVPGRLARVFHDHPLVYQSWTIPPGAAVSQSAYFTQTDPTIFPDPARFNPERWLDNSSLQRYQVAFSKGRRMCIGMNLAYAEMRLALAVVFRRFDLVLFETSRKNVDMAHDFFVSHAGTGFKSVRVRVDGEGD